MYTFYSAMAGAIVVAVFVRGASGGMDIQFAWQLI